MTINQARLSLVVIFLGSLVIQATAFFSIGQYMWPEEMQALILKLLAVYSVHLGVIAGGMFAQSGTRNVKSGTATAVAAILLALVWNLLLVGRSLSLVIWRQDSVADLIRYLGAVADYGSFLVAAALAFFFSSKTKEPDKVVQNSV
jgi:hypothetical protein